MRGKRGGSGAARERARARRGGMRPNTRRGGPQWDCQTPVPPTT
jgi:hypothetical protein